MIFHHVLCLWVVKLMLSPVRELWIDLLLLHRVWQARVKNGGSECDDPVNELLAEMDLRHTTRLWRWWFVVWILGSCSTLMSWKKGPRHLLIRMRVLMTFIITCACPGILLINMMTNFTLLEFQELCAIVCPTLASTARSLHRSRGGSYHSRETPKGKVLEGFSNSNFKLHEVSEVHSSCSRNPNSSQSIN